MREYKFRGKMTEANEWIYGTLLRTLHPPTVFATGKEEKNKYYIQFADPRYTPDWNMPYRMVQGEVIPDTIGQYTGLHDKNGKEIYEGDIVKYKSQGYPFEQISEVRWVENDGYIRCGYSPLCDNFFDNGLNATDFQVIGNIYDNPELLEKE